MIRLLFSVWFGLMMLEFCCGQTAQAQGTTMYVWTNGGGDGKWTNNANWTPTGHPHTNQDVAVFDGTSTAACTLDTGNPLTINQLSMQGDPVSVNLNSNVTLSNGGSMNSYGSVKIPNGVTFTVAGGTLSGASVSIQGAAGSTTAEVKISAGASVSATLISFSATKVTNEGTVNALTGDLSTTLGRFEVFLRSGGERPRGFLRR